VYYNLLLFRFPEGLRKQELTVVPGDEACPEGGQQAACSAQPVNTGDKGRQVVQVPKSLKQNQLLSVLHPHRCEDEAAEGS
jgi:hypothetical protein